MSQFFLSELVQLCAAGGETDRDVWQLLPAGHSQSDRQRLQRLHRRLSGKPSAKLSHSRLGKPRGGGAAVARAASVDEGSGDGRPWRAAEAFRDIQQLFFLFLTSCDSHSLNRQLMARGVERAHCQGGCGR